MVSLLMISNAHAIKYINSSLKDAGVSTSILGSELSGSKDRYKSLVTILTGANTQESSSVYDQGLPTDAELAADIEYLKGAHEGNTRTIKLDSLFQVSDDSLLKLSTNFNSGYDSSAIGVTPSLSIGGTFAKQLDKDNSLTITLSPKLLLGGKFSNNENRLNSMWGYQGSGTVSNDTKFKVEWTNKF